MIKNLKELSQVLVAVGILISASQEEKILVAIENLSTLPDPQEDSFDFPCQVSKETKDSLEGEDPLSLDLQSTQEIYYLKEEDLHGEAKDEDIYDGINEERDQGHQDYIERWFETTTSTKHHSLLHIFCVSYHLQLLVFHAHIHFQFYMLNMSMNISLYLIHTWFHWK